MKPIKPTLLNTRPLAQSAAITEGARALGFDVIVCPTLDIACMPFRAPAHARLWVFVSANAVRCWLAQRKTLPQGRLIAIGPATAAALERAGGRNILPLPRDFSSEGVLKLSVFDPRRRAGELQVVLAKGQGGREKLGSALRERGWNVAEATCYRRVRRALCEGWERFRDAQCPLVLAMSVESVDALLAATPSADREWLLRQPVLALSERIATALREKGWQGALHIASRQDGEGVLDALARWKSARFAAE